MNNDSSLLKIHAGFAGKVGVARREITPEAGVYARNWGAAEHDTAKSIHRPLTITALTLASTSETEPLVLVEADLGWWRPQDSFTRFQKRVLGELSLDSSRFLFSLTHTHAAPPLMEVDSEDGKLAGTELLKAWMEDLHSATVSVVKQALAQAEPASLDWHTGYCGLAANRDLPDPDAAKDRIVCGYNPNSDADGTLLLGRIISQSGNLLATIVNYACHPTTLAWENTAISPDFIGSMRETMENETGANALFLQGMSGDLAPREQYVGDVSVADRHGRQLGFAALGILNDMNPPGTQFKFQKVVESGAPLAVWRSQPYDHSPVIDARQKEFVLSLKDWPTADQLELQRQSCDDRALEERLRRQRDIRRSMGDGSTYSLPVYAWRIGDAFLVGFAGEAYSQLQIELRNKFPDLTLVCLNLVNGSVGYFPPEDAFDLDLYPVWQTPFDRGCLERIFESMVSLIDELHNPNQP